MPRCADADCGRWRPEYLAPRWASGVRFNGKWYCSRPCVERAARAGLDSAERPAFSLPGLPPLRLGVLLRHMGILSEQTLTAALESQRRTGLRLGHELRRLGVASGESVLRALAAQGGVNYVASFDIARVMHGPSWLPAETVRALGLVPFDTNDSQRRVSVACVAPVPRTAISALAKLTGWVADPYLIDEDVWDEAMRAYRPAVASVKGRTLKVVGAAAAAARVADTAVANRTLTMRSAACDLYTWVRLEGATNVSDLLVTSEKEDECLAASMAR